MRHVPVRELLAGALPFSTGALSEDDCHAIADTLRRSADDARRDGLEVMLSRARVGVMHRDLDRHVLLVNDAYCDIVGRSAPELEGLHFEAFTHPEDRQRSNEAYLAHLARGEPFELEKRYLRPDGTVVWCAVHVLFVLDRDGRPQSTIVIASDITARRHAEDELRESEEHYRHTVELNPQISWTADAQGANLKVSSRWHEVTGLPRDGELSQQWLGSLHPDDLGPTLARWHHALATRTPLDVEYRLRNHDGEYRWIHAYAAARTDAAGEPVRWYGTLEDIHERRLAQDAVRANEERFRLAAQAAGLGVWDYDAVHGRREWSPEFKSMLGLPATAEPSVMLALALVVPEDRHLLQALVDAAAAGDSSARFDVTLRIRRADDGAERWMRTAGWRMHAPSGPLERVLVTIRDVTEERTAEQRVRWTATHDVLTRIPNRAFFTERLEEAIAGDGGRGELALVLLDVDHLKEVNDTIGHDAGDVLLRTFAARLEATFGRDAVIGRLGGDEFAVCLLYTSDAADE